MCIQDLVFVTAVIGGTATPVCYTSSNWVFKAITVMLRAGKPVWKKIFIIHILQLQKLILSPVLDFVNHIVSNSCLSTHPVKSDGSYVK